MAQAESSTQETLDIQEKGASKGGVRQSSDRRLFMQFLAFGDCSDVKAVTRMLEAAGVEGVLYEDVNDPRGIGLLTMSENPEFFVTKLRDVLLKAPFSSLRQKLEHSMFGRTYALGHEPDLEDWLLQKPRRTTLNREMRWAVWYPLRRSGAFSALPPEDQGPILREHGKIGHAFGEAGFASDIRLACFGLDKNDNDFIIGLVGRDLFPLSACVQMMRKTRQTSQYIQSMGPFFVGKVCWQSALK